MSRNVDQIETDIATALRVDSGAHGSVNLRCMVALDFADFVTMCADDVAAAGEYNLPVSDPREGGYDSPGGRALGVMPYRKDAFGPGLDEYVMDKLKTYTPTCDVSALRAMAQGVRAYSKLAFRVSADADTLATVDRASLALLRSMRAVDADMWAIFCENGKQHLDGVASALADIDGHAWENGAVCKGQTEGTRNDPTAQAWIRNGKSLHAYVATNGSVSERDILAA